MALRNGQKVNPLSNPKEWNSTNYTENAPGLNSFSGRTHTCNQLNSDDLGKRVVLCGWVSFKRMFFLQLRDGYGATQVMVSQDLHKDLMQTLSLESVIRVEGVVQLRPEGQARADLPTGAIEVQAERISVLNAAAELPFLPREYQKKNEALRLQYRFLDLRQQEMQSNLRRRSQFTHSVRRHLVEQLGFCEVETPTLARCTPGGAREFPVACHSHPGQFYSLVQSPQQFKQLLMIGGIDRYFQFARCYRDESTRPDRQPEFTQIDLEMSFVQQADVMGVVEHLIRTVWPKPLAPGDKFPVISYRDAMDKYGTDHPDIRYGFLLEDAESLFPGLRKSAIPGLSEAEHTVKIIRWPNGYSRVKSPYIEAWRDLACKLRKCGVARMSVNNYGEIPQSLRRHASPDEIRARLAPNDLFVVAWGERTSVERVLGKVRTDLAEISGTLKEVEPAYQFVWVVDFPLFSRSDGVLTSEHHPFTAPVAEDVALLTTQPEHVRAQHFDLVLNGWEVGGGSIRIHDSDIQRAVLKDILREDDSQLDHLIKALAMGAPPHGGFALGLDRLLAMLCHAPTIREVIAFPKTSEGRDLMMDAPAPLSDDDLTFFHLSRLKDDDPKKPTNS
ncbi:aspartate--tRNA ligase [Tropilaelaps mercedesae]|uniref:Aspartate--tRNA ligase n=1 Tax=Tropilaelaps mercedesae TaxID=418985 RepID=A0A1V9X6J7_9ACAR|nr:aspartate--tRNA ligase [Tropilaelaps mercedesae]